ncbi:GNAT family N-acetyltransferase [Murimonas intestini]|uniref:Diamine N-acetyltransferase n=1 Tax=Murimonas intestini TaxID=1337051 RepID=A0AB73TAF3_9FIRM|nr:GNAT family N-acetyltransferase [Murimonas intestini]MCR1838986.1 GNAT family N-acetyltransferase [Murimonas intestini]MCR1864282.1 GNAT family N-acetyltransferase [Murimonas intestini]MCR1881892.1 GNAT family N-acetyltransferase [Murimonas intestini]
MNLHFEPVSPENRTKVEELQILPEQAGFIESVRECMAEADEFQEWKPVGIYDGDLLVGFAMYGYFSDSQTEGEVWLDRILIDRRYQKKGYGKAAVLALLKRLQLEYGNKQIYLSVYENNEAAVNLYQQTGFQFNGKLDTKGEKIMSFQSN